MSKNVSRRDFLKGSAAGVLGVAATGLLGSAFTAHAEEAQAESFEKTVNWDAEFDVVVVGFGAAGAAAAITAADNGAKVLLLEKATQGRAGGNSAVCKQLICYAPDKDLARTYIQSLRGNYLTPSDEMIDTYVEEVAKNWEWCVEMGAADPTERPAFLEFPDIEGAGGLQAFTIKNTMDDGSMYNLMRDNVLKRENITVWYEAPGKKLVQDPATKIIHGVVAEVEGEDRFIRAMDGVILTCGGFEANRQMQEDYYVRNNLHSLGNNRYNTGDGIKMAQAVGADLWHMGNMAGPWFTFMEEETETVFFNLQGPAIDGIYVGPDGTRFCNEYTSTKDNNKHGKAWFHGTYMMVQFPEYAYSVFDDPIFKAGPLISQFTADNQEELEKGWIVKADTLEELAGLIGVDPAGLAGQVADYNMFIDMGKDYGFGRDIETMKKIETAPYYALKITPALINTQGGPVRNLKGEILDVEGNPIPHLYESGELGDIWSNNYQASCNIGGGLAFGRISGRNAAEKKTDNDRSSMMEGKTPYAPAGSDSSYETAENEYIGRGQGKGGTPIVVKVTVDGDKITAIEVLDHSETPGIGDLAFEKIPQMIIDAQSTEVDAVAGATLTSNGIIEAVKDALAQANLSL